MCICEMAGAEIADLATWLLRGLLLIKPKNCSEH
jgi:hypothetical protein